LVCVLASACVLAVAVAVAHAQPLAPTFNPGASPIVVSQTPEKIAVRPTVADRLLINAAFGGVVMGGNTKSYAANLGFRFGYNRDRHQLTVEALGSVGYARQRGLMDVEPTAQNTIGRARYDLFLSANDALFIAMAPRHDKFAGLKLRLQNQIGYSRNLYASTDVHRLWSEVGYDYTHDRYMKPPSGTTVVVIAPADDIDTKSIHSARFFAGYTAHLSTTANLSLGVEALLDVRDRENVRVNSLAELTSSITQSFKLGVQSRLMFSNVPAPGITQKKDVIMAVQMVYTFDSNAVPTVAPCPVCDCSTQVNAARAACVNDVNAR
jgi:putative salt-induced outer membrane protein YdiY